MDRVAVAYIALPLAIFLFGWLKPWAALPLLACVAYSLRSLVGPLPDKPLRHAVTPLQWSAAVTVGVAWTLLGGADHILFANADWYVRDAVLHDLVASQWPVGYGTVDGKESLLRAPIAYYLPAALFGKWAGLAAAHAAMGVWTAIGTTLFLLQVMSLTAARLGVVLMVSLIIVFFSGWDIIGCILNYGSRFLLNWHMASHLEWWAITYQYSSMTTQLFWVPNHALGAWLVIGLLYRNAGSETIDATLPMVSMAAALWSPLSALGLLPFVVWKVFAGMTRDDAIRLFRPHFWLPALIVGLVVAAYLLLDTGGVARGLALGKDDAAGATSDLLRLLQFFLLEAGFIGIAILAIKRTGAVVLALAILAVLPLAYLGPGNDLVMRASIPSLGVLAIASCVALSVRSLDAVMRRKKALLAGMLAIGAVTPAQEIARSVYLPAWPINLTSTLVGVSCGGFAPHYVARLGQEAVRSLLRAPHAVITPSPDHRDCDNPAYGLMSRRGLL